MEEAIPFSKEARAISDLPLVAYAAGFFDADGSVFIAYRQRRISGRGQWAVYTTIFTTTPSVVRLFAEQWGGSIGPTPGGVIWRTSARTADRFLRDLLPWLTIKRTEALLATRFRRECLRKPAGWNAKREWYRQAVHMLKSRRT